jgi:ABC-type uncharacterized transport system substrate-binding protein
MGSLRSGFTKGEYVMNETIKTIHFNLLFLVLISISTQLHAQKCMFVSSYHIGYAWSDGVERGLRETLVGKCELKQFNMDTKRNKKEEDKRAAALKAKELIESWRPDVVITADDNAAKYLIQPYFKDHKIPFVFCGINWNVDAYNFPYSNTTGMVEVAPIDALFEKAKTILGPAKNAIYIGANTLTEKKNLKRFQQAAQKHNITLDYRLVNSRQGWMDAYLSAQESDFILVGSHSGISDWNENIVVDFVKTSTQKLSLTNHGWMMPFSVLGLVKVPEEHGEWAALAALEILRGTKPSDIPIVSNRRWDILINSFLLQQSGIEINQSLLRKAKKVGL